MIRFVVALVAVLAAVLLVVASLATTPRVLHERPVLTLSDQPQIGWVREYCIPAGTLFAFAWTTNDGSSVRVAIFSPEILAIYQYMATGPSGHGAFFSAGQEYFGAGNFSSTPVVVTIQLDYNLTVPVFSAPPGPGGACLW